MRIVDAGLDDGRAQQQVVLLLREFAHHAFQFAFRQLAVTDDDACFGQQGLQPFLHVLDGVDFVVQEVYLAAAFEFAQ